LTIKVVEGINAEVFLFCVVHVGTLSLGWFLFKSYLEPSFPLESIQVVGMKWVIAVKTPVGVWIKLD
jgi:hypothetical protein